MLTMCFHMGLFGLCNNWTGRQSVIILILQTKKLKLRGVSCQHQTVTKRAWVGTYISQFQESQVKQ